MTASAAADYPSTDRPRAIAASAGASGVLERASASPRREVQNAMRALREMPPYARDREIDSGRYSRFSPEEKEMLRNPQQ